MDAKTNKFIICQIALVALFSIFAFCFGSAFSQEQIIQIHGISYALKNGRWYVYIHNEFGAERIPNRIIVRRTDRGILTDNGLKAIGVHDIRFASPRFLEGYYVLSPLDSLRSFEVAQTLSLSGLFDYVVLDGYGKRGVTANDQYFTQQWNLSGTKLRMENAWDITAGNPSVILGIVDSGCDYGHPDLSGNIWSNIGWDFVDNDNSPIDSYGHGTNVTGIPGARTNNSIGIAGIAGGWGNQAGIAHMILKDGNSDVPITSLTVQAIEWAANNGAKVINISSSWDPDHPELDMLQSAIDYAVYTHDVVVVAISGNNGGNPKDPSIRYPAKWPNTIAVGATDNNDIRMSCSAYGPELDVVAPNMVYTTDIRGSGGMTSGDYYDSFSGTSAAAPHVAGLAALIRSVDPSLNWSQVRELICNTADKVPGMGGQLFSNYYGYGRINAYQALLMALAYANKTPNISPTIYNNQRILARGQNNPTNVLHEVFAAGVSESYEVFYRRSSNNGSSWDVTARLSAGTENNRQPCLTITDEGTTDGVHVVWQTKKANGKYKVYYRKSGNGGASWGNPVLVADEIT